MSMTEVCTLGASSGSSSVVTSWNLVWKRDEGVTLSISDSSKADGKLCDVIRSASADRPVVSREVFQRLKDVFEEAYGLFLRFDVFAREGEALLPLSGFSRIEGQVPTLFMVPPVEKLVDVVLALRTAQVISLIIVPVWKSHIWYTFLMEHASHRISFPVGTTIWALDGGRDVSVGRHVAFIVDSRYKERAQDIIDTPLPKERRERGPREVLGMQPADFLKLRPKNHWNLAWFLRWGKSCPPPLLMHVLRILKDGCETLYRGGMQFLRVYAGPLKPDEEAKAVEKAEEAVGKGWAAGPFDLPPFPNTVVSGQAIVTKTFTIPKHKWADDGALRLIFHKSFPLGQSINSITPHRDVSTFFPKGGHQYFSLAPLMAMLIKTGRGTDIIQFDARDAYKQIRVRIQDLPQQCFMAGGKFYVDFCVSFGSLYGSDAYSCVAYVHRVCLAAAAKCPLLRHYVDNYIELTPFCGSPEKTRATSLAKVPRLKTELKASGMLYHDFQGPTTRTTFVGWVIDTMKMTVEVPAARREFIISYLEQWKEKESFSLREMNSFLGVLIFISQVVGGLKASIGIFILVRNGLIRSAVTTAPVTNRIRTTATHIQYVLKRWNGVARMFDRDWNDGGADLVIYCDAALDDEPALPGSYGKGAIAVPGGVTRSVAWTASELAESMREVKHSSTHLELVNMLESVLVLADQQQKVLCVCDNAAAVKIARARYSESANEHMESRLRMFDVACCQRDLSVRFRWNSRENEYLKLADRLSRGEVDIYKERPSD